MEKCLFCRSSENAFSSVEHIIPQSLGNNDLILEKGVVCDKCNHGLAHLDQAICNFDPFLFYRIYFGVKNKEGVIPEARFGNNLSISNPSGNHILVSASAKYLKLEKERAEISARGKKKLTPKNLKLIARALYKMGLEIIHLDHGAEFSGSKRFDEVREIILGKKDFKGCFLITSLDKQNEFYLRYQFWKVDGADTSLFEMRYGFVRIFFDLEIRVPKYAELIPKIPNVSFLEF